MCGVVDGGIVDGPVGLRGWPDRCGGHLRLVHEQRRPARVPPRPRRRQGLGIHEYLTDLAARQAIGEHGLIALDWHSGNRSVLVDHELSGVVVGQTLATRPEDTYRALLEATAFGTRTIVDAFRDSGVPVKEFIVAGGLLKNKLLMQIYADITGLQLSTIGSTQGPALGSAIHAAVAAGEYPDIRAAAAAMGSRTWRVYIAHPGKRRRLRGTLRGVPRAARLLRPRQQRCHAPAQAIQRGPLRPPRVTAGVSA